MIPIIITTVSGREEYLRRTLASIRATVPGIDPAVSIGVGISPIENFIGALEAIDRRDPFGREPATIICEDDVLFCEGWYEALLRDALASKADVISAMSFGEAIPGCWSYRSDGCPCCCLLIRRDWASRWRPQAPTEPIGKSNWLRQGILDTGAHMRILSPHYCQHVGLESTGPLDHRLANRVSLSLAGPLVRGEASGKLEMLLAGDGERMANISEG